MGNTKSQSKIARKGYPGDGEHPQAGCYVQKVACTCKEKRLPSFCDVSDKERREDR